MTKKSIKNIIFLPILLAAGLAFYFGGGGIPAGERTLPEWDTPLTWSGIVHNFGSAAGGCPSDTQVGDTQVIFVGEVTDTGGDPNLEVWFQFGRTEAYGNETVRQSRTGTGLFCDTVTNLDPCATYHYRAIAKNSAGTSYGADKSFTTKCLTVRTDLKVNNSDSAITVNYRDSVRLSWTSENAASCEASGDWSGSKLTSGSETIQLSSVKTYTFTLNCRNASGTQTKSDSVQVIAIPTLPIVITKPAVVTY